MMRTGGNAWRTALAGAALAGLVLAEAVAAMAQEPVDQGRTLFERTCVACHTIGGGRLIGPDLAGVGERRSEEWLISFVQNSGRLIAAGDADAVALFEAYNGIIMPESALSADEVRAILAWIAAGGAGAAAPAPVAPEATEEQIGLGRALFQGSARLGNGGPPCNACHEVRSAGVIGGGVLARELTTAVSQLGGPGVRAILGSPPFPVMQVAYAGRPLTEGEVTALVGFLERADAEQAAHAPTSYGRGLFGAGVAGSAVLLGFYSLAWRGRRRGSIHRAVFDRQVRSE